MGINNSTNAALLAVKILGSSDPAYRQAMADYMGGMSKEVEAKAEKRALEDAVKQLAELQRLQKYAVKVHSHSY